MQMKVLTVRQPWAWAIIHAGKDIENRTWATGHRGPLAIHASRRRPTREDMEWCRQYFAERGVTMPDTFALGVVVGAVDLTDCLTRPPRVDRWWMGPVGWQLRNPRPLPPTPLHGQLGLFSADL